MRATDRPDILHVEDDDEWAALVGLWLGRRGLKVVRARGRAEFDKALRASLPRCILLDVNLDGENGLGLCDEVKRSATLQSVPVIILTGGPSTLRECVSREAIFKLEKRSDAEQDLCAVVASILAQQERSEGVIDAGDLRLDPRDLSVILASKRLTTLEPGAFAALALLVRAAPEPVDERDLYAAFLSRGAYRQKDPEITPRQVVRTYVSKLRARLGPEVGARLVWVKDAGYAYRSISN